MGLIETPTTIAAAGNPPKRIAEYVGRLNTESVALRRSIGTLHNNFERDTGQYHLR